MSDDDRHRRFFCAYRPPPSWFDELARPELHGGARLVAEVTADGAATLVGEAGYVMLPNGNGELALLVAHGWRGWLGPYLLARLVDVAADRGVPNLEADVLLENRAMLALLRHRNAVVMEHDGWSTIRLRVGTSGPPTWAGAPPGARVLVEAPGGRWNGDDDAAAAGLSVLSCFGPASNPRCPALAGRRCPLVEGADAIVVRYPPGDEAWARLVAAHRRDHPETALILEALGTHAAPVGAAEVSSRLGSPRRR
jgi:hypothetical protein